VPCSAATSATGGNQTHTTQHERERERDSKRERERAREIARERERERERKHTSQKAPPLMRERSSTQISFEYRNDSKHP
jgi:hypothetical protein